MAIDPCRGWMVPREERRQALGCGLWLLLSEPVVTAPTCLQTFFFFLLQTLKIKNFKKEFKEKKKKKKKTSVVKKPIFRTQIRCFRALGWNSVAFPSGRRRGLADGPLRRGDELWSLSCTRGRALRKTRVPEGQLHTISCVSSPNS